MQADLVIGEQHSYQADTLGVAARQHRGPGWRAIRIGRIERSQLFAVLSKFVDVWRRYHLGTEAGEVVVTDVIGEEVDDVGSTFFLRDEIRRETQDNRQRKPDSTKHEDPPCTCVRPRMI